MNDKKSHQEKKNVTGTSEPASSENAALSGNQPVFVIQKHDATNVHYDFRLQIEGTLKSWSIPKGPSLDPSHKRLAIPTEDHTLEYADFEGIIPRDHYGAGAVMIWDRGTYRNIKTDDDDNDTISMGKCYENGQIEIVLEGEKIQGGYALIKPEKGNMDDNWLLIKMDDDKADAHHNPVSSENKSVKSGRTIRQIYNER